MLVIRGVKHPGIRSGQLEKRGVIKLQLGTQNASVSTIRPLPLSEGVTADSTPSSQKKWDQDKTSVSSFRGFANRVNRDSQ